MEDKILQVIRNNESIGYFGGFIPHYGLATWHGCPYDYRVKKYTGWGTDTPAADLDRLRAYGMNVEAVPFKDESDKYDA